MAINYTALATEITTDPQALGLPALVSAGNDLGIADALNLVRSGAPFQVGRVLVASYEIINATDPTEWAALTANEKQRYQTLTGAGQVDVSNANLRNAFLAMFSAGPTRTALAALQNRTGSRAENLFGSGTVLTASDVSFALRGKR